MRAGTEAAVSLRLSVLMEVTHNAVRVSCHVSALNKASQTVLLPAGPGSAGRGGRGRGDAASRGPRGRHSLYIGDVHGLHGKPLFWAHVKRLHGR